MDNMNTITSAKSKYEKYATTREQFLERARECSELTLPFLVPPTESGENTKYAVPFQGTGSRGVNNLASKLLLALLPPQAPFFRMKIDDFLRGNKL